MEYKSSDYKDAFKKFSDWCETKEKQINSACHCGPQAKKRTHVIQYHNNLQAEIEKQGGLLIRELKRHINENKPSTQEQCKEFSDSDMRWQALWIKSLEQLVVVEKTLRCPLHNITIIGKTTQSPAHKSMVNPQIRRPISYPNSHNDMLVWDYRHTLSLTGCHKENGSQIDLDSIDEQLTKNLTEFGENYEVWFGKEDEVASIALHSRPPSVEPDEQPEVAKAVISSDRTTQEDINCNLLMLTTPSSMFSVDTAQCHQPRKPNPLWKIFLFAVIILLFALYHHEPHHMHKSYYQAQPPV